MLLASKALRLSRYLAARSRRRNDAFNLRQNRIHQRKQWGTQSPGKDPLLRV